MSRPWPLMLTLTGVSSVCTCYEDLQICRKFIPITPSYLPVLWHQVCCDAGCLASFFVSTCLSHSQVSIYFQPVRTLHPSCTLQVLGTFQKSSFPNCRVVGACVESFNQGKKIYIHCNDGCDRTGALVAILLGRLYQLSSADALKYTQALYDCRDPDITNVAPESRQKSPGREDRIQQVNVKSIDLPAGEPSFCVLLILLVVVVVVLQPNMKHFALNPGQLAKSKQESLSA
jgi:hypothetical protein